MRINYRMLGATGLAVVAAGLAGASAPAPAGKPNSPPTCNNITISIPDWVDTTVNVWENMVLPRCSDPDGDMLTIISTPVPPYGTHVAPYAGPLYLNHTISDGNGGTAIMTVYVAH